MAIDEVLLQTTRSATLRFYRWREASVSFGYFGKIREAEEYAGARAVVRRWTGGGIVPHGDDLTYSLMIASADDAFAFSSRIIYQRIHEVIASCLQIRGVHAQLAAAAAPKVSDACFANPVLADVLVANQKIAGAAQRKTRIGLLQQGSIQRGDLGEEFREMMTGALSRNVSQEQIGSSILQVAQTLVAEKYGSDGWRNRR
ncbi:MAG: hypothetical protein M3R59_10880 [Verrucomicrobiota bacterium]|nr:hypothetical protein [Verrucomicrobiota bacterium]